MFIVAMLRTPYQAHTSARIADRRDILFDGVSRIGATTPTTPTRVLGRKTDLILATGRMRRDQHSPGWHCAWWTQCFVRRAGSWLRMCSRWWNKFTIICRMSGVGKGEPNTGSCFSAFPLYTAGSSDKIYWYEHIEINAEDVAYLLRRPSNTKPSATIGFFTCDILCVGQMAVSLLKEVTHIPIQWTMICPVNIIPWSRWFQPGRAYQARAQWVMTWWLAGWQRFNHIFNEFYLGVLGIECNMNDLGMHFKQKYEWFGEAEPWRHNQSFWHCWAKDKI